MREIVKVFAEEMDKVLNEKFEKYQDSWKETDLALLRTKLDAQVSEFMFQEYLQEDSKRTLVHIANYCLFILTRLNRLKTNK